MEVGSFLKTLWTFRGLDCFSYKNLINIDAFKIFIVSLSRAVRVGGFILYFIEG